DHPALLVSNIMGHDVIERRLRLRPSPPDQGWAPRRVRAGSEGAGEQLKNRRPKSRIAAVLLALILALTGSVVAPAQPAAAATSPLAACKNLTLLKKISCVTDALRKS